MRQWIVEIPGRPVGKESVDEGQGRRHRAPKTEAFMAMVSWYGKQAGLKPVGHCIIDIYGCYPVRIEKGMEVEPKVRADEDNITKGIKDAWHGILYKNDKVVIWGERGYLFIDHDQLPYTRVVITECEWTDFRVRKEETNGVKETCR